MAAAILGLALGAAGSVAGADQAAGRPAFSCAVGRAAHGITPRLPGGLRISDQLDVACGRFGSERVALVGYLEHFRGNRQLCFNLERKRSSVGIECRKEGEAWYGGTLCPPFCIHVFPDGAMPDQPPPRAVVGGLAPLGSARVEVIAGSGRHSMRLRGLVASVDGRLLETFDWDQPAVVFGAVLPRCFHARAVRVIATGADSAVLARERGRLDFPTQCQIPEFPPPPKAHRQAKLR